ncbi:MAG: hypothetical protein HFF69_06220 [Oscillospiraceae bacterium]|jgi:predicted  nucleic acid-binding Zn-ribbon protein|nr:hypothetical protein [Oscillospiraceae bacterium]
MSNEAKILEMLTALTTKINRLEATQAEMQDTLTRVAVTQEGVVLPRIQLALEGHDELKRKLDTLATKEQVRALSSEVDTIKEVVSRHNSDISQLRKAQ